MVSVSFANTACTRRIATETGRRDTPEGGLGRGLTVLVVDDDEAHSSLLRSVLETDDFAVVTVRTAEDARASLGLQVFDFAMVNCVLRDGEGEEIVREIRAATVHTETLLMSAHSTVSPAVAAMQCGVADYFVKPIGADDLHARLLRLVDQRSVRAANARLLAELRDKNAQLSTLVAHDPVTGLYTHVHFHEMLQREITRCRRNERSFSVLLINIDNFSQLNNLHGHAAGDALVEALGKMLRSDGGDTGAEVRLRQHDVAARYGPDTFAVILVDTVKSGAAIMAERLRTHFQKTFERWGPARGLTISVGVTTFGEDGEDRYQLLHAALTSLSAAKALGKNRVVGYSPALTTPGTDRDKFAALDRVLAEELVTFHLQPLIAIATGTVFAYEALCRPLDLAFSSPLDLIRVAGRAGKVWELGRLLRRQAIAALDVLPNNVLLFVNLHPQELYDPQLMAEAESYNERAARLVFEITEAAEIGDQRNTANALERLRRHGLRIALDDLGAGYSGLSTLLALAPDFVKLDMTLIRDIESTSRRARLLRHLVAFTQDEGMTLVAEGVETAAELHVVSELGVPLVQGYYFARPAPVHEVLARTGTYAS